MKHIFSIGLLFFSSLVFSGGNIDSLKNAINTTKHDSVKINAYIKWQSFLSPNEKDEDYEIHTKIISLSDKNLRRKNLKKAEKKFFQSKKGRSLSLSGRYFLIQGDFSRAERYFQEALDIFKTIGNKKEIANCFSNMGVANIYKGNFPEALEFSLQALTIRETIGDTMNMAASYNNAAYLYMVLHNEKKSLEYNLKALKIYEKLKMEQDIAGVYINLGILYRNQKNYKKALNYYMKALPIKEKGNDKLKLGDLYNNISVAYSSLEDHERMLKYAFMALDLHEEINNLTGISGSLANLASAYFELKEYSKAKMHLNRSLEIAKKINHKLNLSHVYLSHTLVDSALGNYPGALSYHKMYIIYRDSLFSEENTRKGVEAEMNYNFEKNRMKDSLDNAKQKEIDNAKIQGQEAELAAQKQQQSIIYFGLVLLIAFAGLMYQRFRLIRRQKGVIEHQKKEVELQKHIVDEKQKEIIDSINYAQRLQQAILAPESEIKNVFPESFLFYKPKDIVAGDFYFFEKTDTHIFYAAADCTGHGVPGAMVSIVCANALTRCVKEFKLTDPGKILDKTRELILETFQKSGEDVKDGMDISLIAFENYKIRKFEDFEKVKSIRGTESSNLKPSNFQIQWSGANNPLWYIENGEMKEIKADKQPIGKTENPKPFTTHALPLSLSALFLFTDGFADQFGGDKGKKFKYSNLQKLLLENSDKEMNFQSQILNLKFNEWKGDLEQIDDVCIIGIKI